MITNRGKDIIARVLAGQTPSAFSYLALGVGAEPVTPPTVEPFEPESFVAKTKMDFEAFRVPISNSSVLQEGGETKIVLSAVLPSAQRYEISEIGAYSAEYNSLLVTEPPRMIYTFSDPEGWEYHTGSTIEDVSYIGSISSNGIDIDQIPDGFREEAFFIAADNEVFFNQNRKNQRMRVYEDAMLLRGDMSTINSTQENWELSGNHVHIASPVNLTRARATDEIKIAFSVINKNSIDISSGGVPDIVRIAIRFMSNEAATEHATLQVEVERTGANVPGQIPASTNFVDNGYYVVSKQKQELKTTGAFSWDNVALATVHVDIEPQAGHTSDECYVAIDAVRFDSNNDNNPTYGLVSYSVVQNEDAATEIKESNVESQIEYKVVVEVGQ